MAHQYPTNSSDEPSSGVRRQGRLSAPNTRVDFVGEEVGGPPTSPRIDRAGSPPGLRPAGGSHHTQSQRTARISAPRLSTSGHPTVEISNRLGAQRARAPAARC